MTSIIPIPFDASSVHRRRLDNGLTVLVRRDASAPVVAIVTYVSAGYFDETDDVVGIAHVLEHMYFKGTPSRGVGEIAKQTKAVGGYLNAATIYDHTSYYTVLPSSGFVHGLEVQADAYANSLIDDDELRRELEVIIQEAKRKADNPGAVAIETLYELLHDVHRIRRWRIGREPGLRSLTRDALMAFYRNFYHPANTVLAIVGDVEPDTAFAHVERLYGSIPAGEPVRSAGPVEPEGAPFRFREWSGDIARTQLALGWRTPPTTHPDTPALDILALVLGTGRASRLYRAVRERQLASSVSAFNYTPTELGVFTIHAECRPESTAPAARAVWDQVARARAGEIGEHEVERARRIYESRWLRRLEDMEGQANYLAEWQSMGDWDMGERYLAAALSATPDQLAEVARRWLDPDRASVLVYRPQSAPPVAGDGESMRVILDGERPAPLEPTEPREARVAAPFATGIRHEREEAGVRVYRTSRGLPVLVRRKPGAPLLHLSVHVLGGGPEESIELAGLTTLMARTAAKGTTTRTALQIAEESEMLGGSIGSFTGSDSFGWSFSVPLSRAAAAVELLADVVQRPSFADAALETERTAAIADVVALRDDMYRYPMRLATRAAFAGHPYGTPVTGTEESLARVTVDHLREWHERHALRGPGAVVVVGEGDLDELAARVIAAFDAIEWSAPAAVATPRWGTEPITTVETRERAQTALAMLFPGPSRVDPDRFAASMIAGVASGLGGRFFDELRDKRSLCYTVQAFASERRAAGSFVAYIATSPQQEEEAREGLLEEFRKLRETPVSAEELERAQTYSIGVHQIRRQSGGAIMGEIADAWLFGSLEELVTAEENIRAVTAERMQGVAARYFDPAVRVEGVVRGS